MATTYLSPNATTGQPYAFVAKSPSIPLKGVGLWTQLHPSALPGERYSFLAKAPGVVPLVALDVDWLYRHDRHYPAVALTVGTPFAEFTWDATTDPPTVYFTSQSVGATSWLWDFGDSQSSSDRDPTHTFAFVGDIATFAVTLVINGDPLLSVTHMVEVSKLLGGPVGLDLNTLTMAQLNTLTIAELNTLTVT